MPVLLIERHKLCGKGIPDNRITFMKMISTNEFYFHDLLQLKGIFQYFLSRVV